MDSFFALLDSAAKEVEAFVTTVASGIDLLAEVLVETADDAAEQMLQTLETTLGTTLETTLEALETTLETEVSSPLNDWLLQPFLELWVGMEDAIDEATPSLHQDWQPLIHQHPACVGCQHYHGQIYGDTPLVCGMHPYGWEGEICPDHEAIAP